MSEMKTTDNAFDWDNFDGDDDFLADAKPVDVPKACSIADGQCEACQ